MQESWSGEVQSESERGMMRIDYQRRLSQHVCKHAQEITSRLKEYSQVSIAV